MYKCYKCYKCGGEFLVCETIPSNCPFCLDKDSLNSEGVYGNLKECMGERKYAKVKSRVVSR